MKSHLPADNPAQGASGERKVGTDVTPEFLGKEITVVLSGELRIPLSFRLDNRKYQIEEVLDSWQDYGFGRAPLKRRRWWHRHHRNYFQVKVGTGEVFEIYHERGTTLDQAEKGKWYVHRKL